MLPNIANQKSPLPFRNRILLLLCVSMLIVVPTLYQPAHSQFGGQGGQANVPDAAKAAPQAVVNQRPLLPAMAPPSVEYLPQPEGTEKKILEILDQKVDLDFNNESLDGVVAMLQEQHGLSVLLNRLTMEEESIASNANDITLKLSGISLRAGLKILLRSKQLAFLVEDEVVKITTLSDAISHRPTRTYPVRDLVGNVDGDYKLLAKTIQESLGGPPDDPWMEVDGEGGSVSILPAPGCLVIRQTPQIHDEILRLLRSLRQANAETKLK